MSDPPSRARMLALDGVRGLAVLLVLAHDYNVIRGPLSLPGKVLDHVMDAGWLGVQIFFVLSGFLITGILLEARNDERYYGPFMGRRVLRIFPLYYAVLTAAFVVAPLISGHPLEGHEHQVWLWTYTSNWAEPSGRGVPLFPHFWSLAIEEQFYLAWPFLVRVLAPHRLLALCIALVVVALASRIALRAAGLGSLGAYMFTICRIDALAIGAIAAILFRRPELMTALRGRRRALRGLAAGGLLVTIVLTRGAPRAGLLTQTFGYAAFAVLFGVLVLDAALTSNDQPDLFGRVLLLPPLRSVGKYSYAMYIFHTPLHLLVGLPLLARLTGDRAVGMAVGIVYFSVATLVTFLVALLSFHLLEKHFLKLKRLLETPHRASGA